MTPDEARQIIFAAIGRVAPEIDPSTIDPTAELQLEADLDSMDFLHVIESVSTTVGRDIAERDYPRISTIDGFVAFLTSDGDR